MTINARYGYDTFVKNLRCSLSTDVHRPLEYLEKLAEDDHAKIALAIVAGGKCCIGRGSTPLDLEQGALLEKAERRTKVGVDKSPRTRFHDVMPPLKFEMSKLDGSAN